MKSSLRSFLCNPLAVLAALSLTTLAHATPINVVNGSFEQTTTKVSSEFGDRYPSQQVTGWTSTGYNFVFLPGTADTTGAASEYNHQLSLWGPGNGSNNGLTGSADGGNFLAMDGAYAQGPISQTLSGLTSGLATTVSFYFAGAQQSGFNGATTEQLKVTLGGQSLYTEVLNDPNHGFTGWKLENLTFMPTSTSAVLSFLAVGTPNGEPPMSLLDGVSVSQASPVPEPSSIALLMTGFAGASGLIRSRLRKGQK